MSKYDVYGIGNALVDMEFEVTDQFLQEMNVEKGLMTLVDEARQTELLAKLTQHGHRCCGGSAANSIIAVSQLGGKSFYSCKVATDETGDFYFKDLQNEGVSTNLSNGRQDGVTGKCMVMVTPDAERTMNTYLGITETFSESELVEDELGQAQYLYIEGYLVTSDTGRAAAQKAKAMAEAKGVKTAMTFSDPAMVKYFKEGLVEMLGDGVDLLFCNEEEAMEFTETSGTEAAAEALKKYAKNFAITLGPKGAMVFDGDKLSVISTTPAKAVDTNGAGDLFAGSFLYGITNGHDYESAATLACSASSLLVTQFGSRLRREQILEVKERTLFRNVN